MSGSSHKSEKELTAEIEKLEGEIDYIKDAVEIRQELNELRCEFSEMIINMQSAMRVFGGVLDVYEQILLLVVGSEPDIALYKISRLVQASAFKLGQELQPIFSTMKERKGEK